MISSQYASDLIALPKKLIEGEAIIENKLLSPSTPFQERFYLVSEFDRSVSCFIEVYQSAKNRTKISLHCQDEDTSYGLIRVDYNGRHKNPEMVNEHVPAPFLPYAGEWLDDYAGHIHYVIDGYAPLNWAIPLEVDPFDVKEVNSFNEFATAFESFCRLINLQTNIRIHRQLTISL